MESNEFINLYITKIFEELNEATKEKIIFKANVDAANIEIEKQKKDLETLQAALNEFQEKLVELQNKNEQYSKELETKSNHISAISTKLREAENKPGFDVNEKIQLLNQIADLNEKLRLSNQSNSFLIKSVKEKEAKIVQLSILDTPKKKKTKQVA